MTVRPGPGTSITDLAGFTGRGYDKGRSTVWQALWFATSYLVVQKWWCLPSWRVRLLRAFGARIGDNVLMRHGVRIHWPWKLTIGSNVWIGEDAWILNLEPVTIADNVCISQAAFLCTGSHDRRTATFEFDNGPIVVQEGAWVAARATVLRGVTVGAQAIVGAGAVASRDLPPGSAVIAPGQTLPAAADRVLPGPGPRS